MVFKNSTGYWCAMSASRILSELRYTWGSPGNIEIKMLFPSSTVSLVGQIIALEHSHSASLCFEARSWKTWLHNWVSESPANAKSSLRHILWGPTSVATGTRPSPISSRWSAKVAELCPASSTHMFLESFITCTCCHKGEDFRQAATISGRAPFLTIGKICRQSPANTTVMPPKGLSVSLMSLRVLSTASYTCRWAMVTSSMTIR